MRFLADENLHNDILKGLHRRIDDLDIIRVQDTEIYMADDPTVLDWAATENRILITHDVRTMPHYVYQRIREGKYMPGVIEIANRMPIGEAIEELVTIILIGVPSDFENLIKYLPLR